jgi:hypothetical protein
LRCWIPFATTFPNRTSPASKLSSPSTARKSSHAVQFSQKRSLVTAGRPLTLSLNLPLLPLRCTFELPSRRCQRLAVCRLKNVSPILLLQQDPFRTFLPDHRTTPRWPTVANVN